VRYDRPLTVRFVSNWVVKRMKDHVLKHTKTLLIYSILITQIPIYFPFCKNGIYAIVRLLRIILIYIDSPMRRAYDLVIR
jgi:hypothetical protein